LNILFVHEVDWLRKVVFEIHTWSELLSGLGHEVFAIDFENEWSRERLLDLGTLKTEVFENVSRTGNNSSITVIRPGFVKAPLLDRATAMFTHYFEIDRVIKDKQIDVIILYSAPTNGYQAIKIASKHKIPVIFRSIDNLHMLVPNKALRPVALSLEKWVYKHADKILTLSPKLSEYVISYGAEKDRVEMVPFCVNVSTFKPGVNTSNLKKSLGIDEENKIVVFMGTLFEFSGLDLFMEQFPKVVEAVPMAKLVIVGGGPILHRIQNLSKKLGLENEVIFTGFQPFSTMPQFINLADICINPFLINETTRDIIPGKIIQYLACGKPVLATPLPGMLSLLSGLDCGIVYSDISKFAENTIKLLKDKRLMELVGENGYRYVQQNHDERKMSHRLSVILNELTNEHSKE
jgi:glycosyltransferase involved in cell wall biosynthesis